MEIEKIFFNRKITTNLITIVRKIFLSLLKSLCSCSGYRLIPCVLSYAGQIYHAIEDFVPEQIRFKLQIADGQADSTKLKAMVKHWSQQMSAAVNRETSRNVARKASQMVDKASLAQRSASATIDSGDDFSHQSTQAKDNYDNFGKTIMGLEASQTEDPLNQAPQPANHYGAVMEETCTHALLP